MTASITNRTFENFPLRFSNYSSDPFRFSGLDEKQWSSVVMKAIKPYFLAPYKMGDSWDRAVRWIRGVQYKVERYNHGLAHGMRQGALAKDIFYLLTHAHSGFQGRGEGVFEWAKKANADPYFVKKLELASSFQRSGREMEGGSSAIPDLYKKFELQDTVNFKDAAFESGLFSSDAEIQVFEEAILWSNKGILNEESNDDLKYIRRILHAAHTLDLRRMLSFDAQRIKKDACDQLFGNGNDIRCRKIIESLWNRSGEYLKATGDRDLVSRRGLQNTFFLQSRDPILMVNAIDRIGKNRLTVSNS